MQGIIQILIGTSVLSIIHVAIPHHWFPIIAISKSENWLLRETLLVASIIGISHTVSTIAIGAVVGLIGYKLSPAHEFVTKVAAPLILVTLGLIYVFLGIKKSRHHHHIRADMVSKRSKVAIITSLSAAMFFTPCTEIEAYYFTAGALLGWTGITIVSIVYLIITVLGMLLLVYLGVKGIERVSSHFLEHHEKQIAGIVLIVLGIFSFFVEI